MPNSLPALNGGIPDWIFPVLLHRAGSSVRSAGGSGEDVLAAELALIYANTVKTLILPAVLFQRPVGKDLIPFSPLSAQGALAYLQFTE